SLLSGEVAPNLGHYRRKKAYWDEVLDYFAGTELHDYLERIASKKLTTAIKPQYVDKLSKIYTGRVRDLLTKIDKRNRLGDLTASLDLESFLDRDIAQLSGGELQRMAIAATMLRDADIYFFDEPSSYLDIYQRLQVAKVIQSLSKEKYVVVVEHDLAVLDFLADTVFLMYGEEGAYGIIAQPRPVRTAINVYLGGYRGRAVAGLVQAAVPRGRLRRHGRRIASQRRRKEGGYRLLRDGDPPAAQGQRNARAGRFDVVRRRVAARRHRPVSRPGCGHLSDRRAVRLSRFEPADGGRADDPTGHGEGSAHRAHRRSRRVLHRHGVG